MDSFKISFIAKLIIIPATIIKIICNISVVMYLYKNIYDNIAPNGSDKPLMSVVKNALFLLLVE